MSKYTTELRYICETESGLEESVGYNDVASVIANAIPKVFSFNFPIFDENYRTVLETKILKHYYTREICEETYGLWKLRLDQKLNEIMPYYNQLYKSALLEFNPFYDVDLTTQHSTTQNLEGSFSNKTNEAGTGKAERTETGKEKETINYADREHYKKDLYSDTPQNGLDNVEGGDYLTNARITTDIDSGAEAREREFNGRKTTTDTTTRNNIEGEGTNQSETTEQYLETVKGKRGGNSYAKLLQEYRKTFLNIDLMVIEELNDLFILLW